jgi:hypothetical protein
LTEPKSAVLPLDDSRISLLDCSSRLLLMIAHLLW